ncbi:MAG TPA: hypothetical protein ENF38_00600 [Candidatus Aenigmarchaeota archaeon]|nr:hypothetical protein [Candidatus Aenigmarchaeota archaeon]
MSKYFRKLNESIERLDGLLNTEKIGELETGEMGEIIKKIDELTSKLDKFQTRLKEIYEIDDEQIRFDWEDVVEYA